MKYVAFIGTDGPQPDEAVQVMQRELPGWTAKMAERGVRLFGRELDFPDKAATVRVRDGETLVSDGPFAETKEFVGGFDLLDCADLDEAIEVMSKSPVGWFLPVEIRPMPAGARLGADLAAFAQREDAAGVPYLLTTWTDPGATLPDCEEWRAGLADRLVLGGALAAQDTATTLRHRDGETQLHDGPFVATPAAMAALDVIRCADRQQAVELAARHPAAGEHTIEVRPFWSE